MRDGLAALGRSMEWGEALRLVRILCGDPSSQTSAALNEWAHPLDRTGWMLADLLDIQGGKALGKKWKTYPRPSKAANLTERYGNAAGQSVDQVKERLRLARLGETLPPI